MTTAQLNSRLPWRSGRTHDDDRQQRLGRGRDGDDRAVDLVEQDVLEQQVVDGVAGQAQLGEEGHRDALRVPQPHLLDDRLGVAGRVARGDREGAGRDPREAVAVGRREVRR